MTCLLCPTKKHLIGNRVENKRTMIPSVWVTTRHAGETTQHGVENKPTVTDQWGASGRAAERPAEGGVFAFLLQFFEKLRRQADVHGQRHLLTDVLKKLTEKWIRRFCLSCSGILCLCQLFNWLSGRYSKVGGFRIVTEDKCEPITAVGRKPKRFGPYSQQLKRQLFLPL